MTRSRLAHAIAACVLAHAVCAPAAAAQGYPAKLIRLIVPWPPGGGVDISARTPRDVVARLNREINGVVRTPDIRARLTSYGLEVVESTPEEYTVFRKSDAAKWAKIIKDINLKYD